MKRWRWLGLVALMLPVFTQSCAESTEDDEEGRAGSPGETETGGAGGSADATPGSAGAPDTGAGAAAGSGGAGGSGATATAGAGGEPGGEDGGTPGSQGGEGGAPIGAGGAADEVGGAGGAGGEGTPIVSCEGLSLLENCSFELPVVQVGSFQLFNPGQEIAGWTVIGASGNVAPLSTTYVQAGLAWPALDGEQTLDLTGLTNTATGVSQAVETSAGERYSLSFWSGNVVAGGYGPTSTVQVLVDDVEILRSENVDGEGTRTLAWQNFTVEFEAAAEWTTIAFVNADPSGDNSNIIDNVTLTVAE